MTTWNLEETRGHIKRLFGPEQLELAKPSLRSVIDRRRFAHYHFDEARSILSGHIDQKLASTSMIEVLLGGTDEEQSKLDLCLTMVGANVLACVQSIHAIGDIFGHALYFSLGLNSSAKPLPARDITSASVAKLLRANAVLASLSTLLEQFSSGGEALHIAALANQGKHRSIIRTNLWADATGSASNPYELRFESFSFKETTYAETSVKDLLTSEHDRVSKLVVDTGVALNATLSLLSPV
ncbi:hypothetical protein [Derxia lacustris]|uniref:hypothetical protein n=1 Tax=Derxia lacustris TaxID=764842 RepID=UPI00111C7D30|nr:hypothetical protein [Derxia lacustris]